MDEFLENINEYNRIASIGVRICDDLLEKLKIEKSNTEASVTLFAGFDDIRLLYLNILQLINSDKSRVFPKTSLLSLSRSMIELTNTIHFFFLDNISDSEAKFRLQLFNFISKKERFEIVKKMDIGIKQRKDWNLTEEVIENEKVSIIDSDFFKSLISENRISDFNCLINENDRKNKYYKRFYILKSRDIDSKLIDWYYKLSSSNTHGSPASIDRSRQKYINKDLINKNNTTEILSVMQIASSFYCCTMIDIITYYKLDNMEYIKPENKLVQDYSEVIKNVPITEN